MEGKDDLGKWFSYSTPRPMALACPAFALALGQVSLRASCW